MVLAGSNGQDNRVGLQRKARHGLCGVTAMWHMRLFVPVIDEPPHWSSRWEEGDPAMEKQGHSTPYGLRSQGVM